MAGPTTDYGYTSFGSDVTTKGYVSEDASNAKCGNDGTCTYHFRMPFRPTPRAPISIGIEGRRGFTLIAGTNAAVTTEYGAVNKVFDFSVDGSPVQHRRQVVDIAKCNGCHVTLSLHGENRNQIEMCVLCHNPTETDDLAAPGRHHARPTRTRRRSRSTSP